MDGANVQPGQESAVHRDHHAGKGMTPPLEIFAVTPRAAKRATGIVLVLLWLALGAAVVSRPAVAAETPDKMVPPPAPK